MSINLINLEFLLEQNEQFIKDYEKNELMVLIKSSKMEDVRNRSALLDCIQVFSNYFQKAVMLRSVFTETKLFSEIAQEHLTEEFGHNVSLSIDRGNRLPQWDPILEACSSWFSWKMLTSDNIDKTFLMHLVLESSANLFFCEAHKVMAWYEETDYFKFHSELDEKHQQMGIDLLKGLRETDYAHLLVVQQQGWDVLNTVCRRIAELTLSKEQWSNYLYSAAHYQSTTFIRL